MLGWEKNKTVDQGGELGLGRKFRKNLRKKRDE